MRPESRWRIQANAVIEPILSDALRLHFTEARLRNELREAYPFGERANHPYKIWLSCQRAAIARYRATLGISEPFDDLPLFAGAGEP